MINKLLPLVIVFLGVSTATAAVIHVGTFGRSYAIAEPDALKELKGRAAHADWNKFLSEEKYEKAIREYQPDTIHLPRAQNDRTRLVDMTYTLPWDIPDGKGGILYPRGYTYNPLDYVDFTQTLIVINGDDPDQVKWFKNSKYADTFAMLLLSEGAYYELGKKFDRPVFYASAEIIQRFQLQAVPSIIRQKGKYMEVREIGVPKNK